MPSHTGPHGEAPGSVGSRRSGGGHRGRRLHGGLCGMEPVGQGTQTRRLRIAWIVPFHGVLGGRLSGVVWYLTWVREGRGMLPPGVQGPDKEGVWSVGSGLVSLHRKGTLPGKLLALQTCGTESKEQHTN